MRRTDGRQGRRLPDTHAHDAGAIRLEPGDYMKVLGYPIETPPENLTGTTWYVCTPNGLQGCLHKHTVREHDDGTITVAPGDGSSNSILVQSDEVSWHGYITAGLWWGA